MSSTAITAPSRFTPSRRELVLSAGATLAVAALILAIGPAPGDAPAHLYRTFLVEHGIVLWDNLWYGGQYPLTSYSLLYYFPAAVVGNLPLVLGAAVVGTVLFAFISYREWGLSARWPTRIFGVLAAAPMFTGLYPYTLGFVAMLAALRLLQSGSTWLVIFFAVLTLGFSPLAFCFLGLILFAIFVARRPLTWRAVRLGTALALVAGFELLVLIFFPTPGTYPFHAIDLLGILATSTAGALLAWRGSGDRLLAWFFVSWAVGGVVSFAIPNAVGGNWDRLYAFVFPLMLIAAYRAHFQPRRLAVAALAIALVYNLTPYLMLIPYRLSTSPQAEQFWQPAISYLDTHAEPQFRRVEVVPTAAHWEAYWIPREGFALARGWYRQTDEAINPIFYRPHITGAQYRAWLRAMGVRYVLLANTKLDPVGGPMEASLLRSGDAGLREVFHTATWTIYALPHPTPLLTGPAPATLATFGADRVVGHVAAAGTYLLRVRYTPYWQVTPAGTCLAKAPNGMTNVALAGAGRFSLQMPSTTLGSLAAVVRTIAHPPAARCPAT